MSKYDFELNLNENSSTGKILRSIEKGSTVLEFGCANGRMTKYMQQELECEVYIVEIDQKAFCEARQYACYGVCGDILKGQWMTEFPQGIFDYVIFADVLEHLVDPVKALKLCMPFLKENGKVIFSIPNLAHSDILNNLYNCTNY